MWMLFNMLFVATRSHPFLISLRTAAAVARFHAARNENIAHLRMDLNSVPLLYAIVSKSQHFADISFANYCKLRPAAASYGHFRTKSEAPRPGVFFYSQLFHGAFPMSFSLYPASRYSQSFCFLFSCILSIASSTFAFLLPFMAMPFSSLSAVRSAVASLYLA